MAKVKLSDVAEAAGVSLGTASNAFNRPDRVRPEVRAHIEATARALGYGGPDPVGRLLMGGKANALGLTPPGAIPVATALRSPFFREFTYGVAEACDAEGAILVMISGDPERKDWAIRNALVDGFIFGHRDDLTLAAARNRKVPAVVMDMAGGADAGSIRIDARDGAEAIARHLLDLGHRRFAIASVQRTLAPPILHQPGAARQLRAGYPIDKEKLAGFASALGAAGLSIDEMPIVEFYPHAPDPAAGARVLLDALAGATAVMCMADRQAMVLLEEARQRGIRVPEDLSITGFDDASEAAGAQPPLTTVAQPIVDKGRMAADMIFNNKLEDVTLPVHLVIRGSTAKPKA